MERNEHSVRVIIRIADVITQSNIKTKIKEFPFDCVFKKSIELSGLQNLRNS